MTSASAIQKIFADFGISEDDFNNTFESFEVAQKLRLADDLARRYSIASTPSVVVNGKYRTNAGEAGGSYSKLLNVIDELIANFPNRFVALFLRATIFPFGKWLCKPSDNIDHQVAKILQTPSDVRTRLGQGQYITANANNPLGQLEVTLANVLASEPIFNKVCQALGKKLPFIQLDVIADKGLQLNVISKDEAELLKTTELGRLAAINVDDFDSSELCAAHFSNDQP